MTPKKVDKTRKPSPKKADSTGTMQETSTRDEGGISIGAWRQRRTKELDKKTLPVMKVIASAYDIDVGTRPTKAEVIRQVISAEEESLRGSITEATDGVVDDGSVSVLWPEVNSSRSQDEADCLRELATLLEHKLKVSEERSRDFVLQSGIASVSELAILDETARAELASQHKFGTVVASKFRAVCKDIRSGTGVGVADEGN